MSKHDYDEAIWNKVNDVRWTNEKKKLCEMTLPYSIIFAMSISNSVKIKPLTWQFFGIIQCKIIRVFSYWKKMLMEKS